MDINGHFSNHFTIDQQVFGEKFKVILKSSIYLIDKNGNISRQTEKKIISDWICADENIVPELGNGLDIADIIVDEIHENDNGYSDIANKKTEVCTAPILNDTHEYTTSGETTRKIGGLDGIEISRGLKLKLNLESFKIKACSTLEKTLSTVTKEMNLYNIALDASSQIVDLDTNSIDKDSQEVSEATYCVEDQSGGRCISDKSSYIYGTIDVADQNTENENLHNDNDEVPTLFTCLNNTTNINAELREESIANTYNVANVNNEIYSKAVWNGNGIHYDSLEINDGIGSSEPIEVTLWDPFRMPSSLERKHQIVEAFKSHDSKQARHESSPDYSHFDVEIYTSYSTDTDGQDNHENDLNSTQRKETIDKRTTNQIEKMKKALINQGLVSKIPTGEMSSTLLLAKLRLEVEAAKRVTVALADHKDKFEKVKFISMEQRHRSTRIKDKSYISYMCKVCDSFQVGEEEKMRLHLEQHLNGDFKCKFCSLDCKHPRERKQHYKEHHPNERLRPPAPIKICEKCGRKTASSVAWKNHTYKCLGIPSFSCQICSEKFPSNKNLKEHIRNDHTDCTYFCEKCDQQFTDETHWAVHTVRCEGGMAVKGSYSCHLCERLLSSLTQLKRHIRRNHDKEKQYQCQLCSYSSFRPQRMKHHMAVHEGKKPHKCEHCDYAAVQKFQLVSHMRTHSKEKPYKCDQCNYASAWKIQLKGHKKLHDLENTESCTQCGIIVKDVEALNRHRKMDHNSDANDMNALNRNRRKDHNSVAMDVETLNRNRKGDSNSVDKEADTLNSNRKGDNNSFVKDAEALNRNRKGDSNSVVKDAEALNRNRKDDNNSVVKDTEALNRNRKVDDNSVVKDTEALNRNRKVDGNSVVKDTEALNRNRKVDGNSVVKDTEALNRNRKVDSNSVVKDTEALNRNRKVDSNRVVKGAEALNRKVDSNSVVKGAEALNRNIKGDNNSVVKDAEAINRNRKGDSNSVVKGAEALNRNIKGDSNSVVKDTETLNRNRRKNHNIDVENVETLNTNRQGDNSVVAKNTGVLNRNRNDDNNSVVKDAKTLNRNRKGNCKAVIECTEALSRKRKRGQKSVVNDVGALKRNSTVKGADVINRKRKRSCKIVVKDEET